MISDELKKSIDNLMEQGKMRFLEGASEEQIAQFEKEIKDLKSENESLKNKMAGEAMGDVMSKLITVKGVNFLPVAVKDIDMNALRNLGDQLKDQIKEGVIVLASSIGADKVNLVAMATKEAMDKGAHAGNLIKACAAKVGGGGGGRPNMAQAGGKNPQGIEDALKEAQTVLEGQLK